MQIILAKTAGFCFGVKRAVEQVEQLVAEGKKVCTMGPIIHNPQMVEKLAAQGVRIIHSPTDAKAGETLVIRSHGVSAEVEKQCAESADETVNATCPFVTKIHQIVAENSKNGAAVLIAGDPEHSEVQGIVGHVEGKHFVFQNEDELKNLLKNEEFLLKMPICMVAQTTFNKKNWEKSKNFLKKVCTNAKIFDTICNATAERQREASELAKKSDVMIVIGGRHSSNTNKLYDICKQQCNRTYLVETAEEVEKAFYCNAATVGIVAGASTPANIIKEVISTMTEEIKNTEGFNLGAQISDDMSFEEALEISLSTLNTEQKVKGVVLAVGPTEIQVDIGRKQAGYVPAEEYSYDTGIKLTDEVKVGDTLDLIIMKTNDQEGTVMLSKRRFDNIANWDKIEAANENQEILEGKVTEIIKGGLIVNAMGYKVFVPASQATISRGEALEPLKGQTVKFKIIEIGRRHRIIGSIRAVLRDERKEQQSKFWETVGVGDVFKGVVKSLTGYGAFVDLGGVDGMVHISELSWQRIKNPAEVVTVGQEIEVYVKEIDTEKKRISLGYKKPDENPWKIFMSEYADKEVVKATIVNMSTYGAFARIIPGVDGLIHISQIANRRIEKPQDELTIGQEVDVKIIGIDEDKKRVSLSIRALLEPETEETAEAEPEKAAEAAAEETEKAETETKKAAKKTTTKKKAEAETTDEAVAEETAE